MARLADFLLGSRACRQFVAALEEKLPPLREWHRFQYQSHFARRTPNARLFSGVYRNSTEALAAIPRGASVGYDHPGAAARQASETERIWPSDYPVLFWSKSLLREQSLVFDLGGAAGISFYAFQKYVQYPRGCSWVVYELPVAVA